MSHVRHKIEQILVAAVHCVNRLSASSSRCLASNMESRRGSFSNKAYTLIEVLITIAIIAVLSSLLLPALGKAKDTARTILCVNNLRTIGTACALYADSYCDFYPMISDSYSRNFQFLAPFVDKNPQFFYCPNLDAKEGYVGSWPDFDNKTVKLSYAENSQVGGYFGDPTHAAYPPHKYSRVPNPSNTVGWLDSACVSTLSPYGTWVMSRWDAVPGGVARWRHLNKINVLFIDSHVNSFTIADNISTSGKLVWVP